MTDLFSNLLGLLEKQALGDKLALNEIAKISKQICGEKVYRDPFLTSQQVRCIELLLKEWRGMFSFSPGRYEGLTPLISLLKIIGSTPQIDQLEIYKRREWSEIGKLRGPVETVQIYECAKCKTKYPRMGMSGFLDLIDLYCGSCGDVSFKSVYDKKRESACPCGGIAKLGCPHCGCIEGQTLKAMSPYQYFSDHRFHNEENQS